MSRLSALILSLLLVFTATGITVFKERVITIAGTKQAAILPPVVFAQLRDKSGPLTGNPSPLSITEERPVTFPAYLDTGSSGHVLSSNTAEQFGVKQEKNAVYVEVGLHGKTTMKVTKQYDLFLSGSTGSVMNPAADGTPELVQKRVRFQVSKAAGMGNILSIAEQNIIGMPAIKKMFITIEPGLTEGKNTISDINVKLSKNGTIPRSADAIINLEYIDYNNRKNKDNIPPLPDLAANPMITGVSLKNNSKISHGNWLLDTGAVASIISTSKARELGLLDPDGKEIIKPSFRLPLSGISGEIKYAPGYVLDELRIPCKNNRVLSFTDVSVVVQDVTTSLDNGDLVTLDGVLGLNLFFPSMSIPITFESEVGDPPFDVIWIDGIHGRLGLKIK